MISKQLIKELDLLHLTAKTSHQQNTVQTATAKQQANPSPNNTQPPKTAENTTSEPVNQATPKIDKNEFRLLVKMLKAIGHDCVFDAISHDGQTVSYQLPNKTLVFNNISTPDTDDTIHLSSLADLLTDESLKRPVWEKLKTIKL